MKIVLKKGLSLFFAIFLVFSCKPPDGGNQGGGETGTPFISTWNTANAGVSGTDQITLPLQSAGTYDFHVDWGDGSSSDISAWDDPMVTHTYASAGIYEINISGTITGFRFNNSGDAAKMTDISQFGDLNLGNSGGYFYGCSNLTISATDAPDFTGATTLADMFSGCGSLGNIPGLTGWDVSGVTDMSGMFQDAAMFDQSVGDWNIGSVTDMSLMFSGVTLSEAVYDDILIKWAAQSTQSNVSFDAGDSISSSASDSAKSTLVTGRGWIISDGSGGPVGPTFISTWNTANAGVSGSDQITLPLQSAGTYDFHVDWGDGSSDNITAWNDTAVTHTYAVSGSYQISITGTIQGFVFNNSGDRLKLTGISQFGNLRLGNIGGSFYGCGNLMISATDTPDLSGTTNLSDMFNGCSSLSTIPGLGVWDVSAVSDFSGMFQDATAFDQSVGDWTISAASNMSMMFSGVTLSEAAYNDILVKWAAQTTQNNVVFNAGDSLLSGTTAVDAKATLAGRGWTITDGMPTGPSFVSAWNTVNASTGSSNSDQITLPLESGGIYDFFVDWGDGNTDIITASNDTAVTHTYASSGIYEVTISGTIQGFRFNNTGDRLKLTGISAFGSLNFGNNGGYFYGCSNLTISATDAPDLTGTTNMESAFYGCSSLTDIPGAALWDVSQVTSMLTMFRGASQFNADISGWNVGLVQNMRGMFYGASQFNQAIGSWTVSSVTTIYQMFYNASAFNQAMNSWITAKLDTVYMAFYGATSFNQDLSNWNTSGVTSFYGMFANAVSYNYSVGAWDVSGVTDMSFMFNGVTLSSAAYDDILVSWAGKATLNDVIFDAGGSALSSPAASTAKTTLQGRGWTITDGS